MEDPKRTKEHTETQGGPAALLATPGAGGAGVTTAISGEVQGGVDAALEATKDSRNQQGLTMLRKREVIKFNAFREQNQDWKPNFSGENFAEMYLPEVQLSNADLRGANLRGANLVMAKLFMADLAEADLCKANLFRADLCRANLSGAHLRGANLRGANLFEADLSGVKGLTPEQLAQANFFKAKGVDPELLAQTLKILEQSVNRSA